MGHGLIAAEQSRDSPADVYLYSSRRGPCIPRGEAKLSHAYTRQPSGMQRGWGASQGRGCTGGHIPLQKLFLSAIVSVYIAEDDTRISSLPLVPPLSQG